MKKQFDIEKMKPLEINNLSISECYEMINVAEEARMSLEQHIHRQENHIRMWQSGYQSETARQEIDLHNSNIFNTKIRISFLQSEIRRIQNRIQQLTYSKK